MKFQDKFKPGDIICSDRFHNGLCMVVESVKESWRFDDDRWRYSCIDLVKEHQRWHAYERDDFMFKFDYNWRIATDDDIANYLSRFLHIPLGKVGAYEVSLTDDGVRLDDDSDYGIYFEAEELVQLGKIINERVVE
jgi:hypothetical protein